MTKHFRILSVKGNRVLLKVFSPVLALLLLALTVFITPVSVSAYVEDESNSLLIASMQPPGAQADYSDAIGGFKTSEKLTYNSDVFKDVNENLWYGANKQAVIKKAYELRLIQGKGSGVFDPGGNLTIAEAIKMAAVVHKIYNGGDGSFTQGSPWYQVYVDYAIESGIISESLFAGQYGKYATRAEMASIFARCVPASQLQKINSVSYLPDVYTDRTYGDGVFLEAEDIFMLYRAGVLTGNDSKGTFRPFSDITRAEAAAIICRIVIPSERKLLNLSQVIISGDYVTEEFYNKYNTFDEFIDFSAPGYNKIYIRTNITIKDFKYIEAAYEPNIGLVEISVLYSQDELSPEKPFVVTWMQPGTLPNRGITFVDENNMERKFFVHASGFDDSLLITEF